MIDIPDNEEAIKKLEELCEYKGYNYTVITNKDVESLHMAIEILRNEKPKGEWIPVSEKLPERYKEVIVTDIETTNTYQSRYIGKGYWECDNGTLKNRIIAWMPLPKPYKEADNE